MGSDFLYSSTARSVMFGISWVKVQISVPTKNISIWYPAKAYYTDISTPECKAFWENICKNFWASAKTSPYHPDNGHRKSTRPLPIGCYKMIYTGEEVKAPPAPADFRNLSTERNIPVEFDESMWRLLVEKVVVKKDGFLKFVFTNGMEVVI